MLLIDNGLSSFNPYVYSNDPQNTPVAEVARRARAIKLGFDYLPRLAAPGSPRPEPQPGYPGQSNLQDTVISAGEGFFLELRLLSGSILRMSFV